MEIARTLRYDKDISRFAQCKVCLLTDKWKLLKHKAEVKIRQDSHSLVAYNERKLLDKDTSRFA